MWQHITYMNIWENTFFLRVLTQVVNVLNSSYCDWNLIFKGLNLGEKSKRIREKIIKPLNNIAPTFQ